MSLRLAPLALAAIGLATPGCFLFAKKAPPAAPKPARKARSQSFVTAADGAYACPTPEQALAGEACEDGIPLFLGMMVTMEGPKPESGAWTAYSKTTPLWIDSGILADQPDYAHWKTEREALPADVTTLPDFSSLVKNNDRLAGKRWFVERKSPQLMLVDDQSEALRLHVWVPAGGSSGLETPIRAYFDSEEFRERMATVDESLVCEVIEFSASAYRYCDSVLLIGTLRPGLEEAIDERGVAHKLPVLEVDTWVDRFGTYHADG